MEVTKKILNTLCRSFQYSIISTRMETRTITNPIPYTTGYWDKQFPAYLKGFEDYYAIESSGYRGRPREWRLKNTENRPCYTITVTYTVFDIELKPDGVKEIQHRYEIHKRNMEKYARLLGIGE